MVSGGHRFWLGSSIVATLVLGGCAAQPTGKGATPANEDTLRLVRQSMAQTDPNVLVGLVTAVLPDQKYASIGDIDIKAFKEGDAITFIDSNKKFITNGLVKQITADTLIVQYVQDTPMSAIPRVGDLAVRFAK